MGLFGFNAKKKLAEARDASQKERLYDALTRYEELLEKSSKLSSAEVAEVESEERRVRQRMIEARMAEAEALESGGDYKAALDRLRTALDLGREDIDVSAASEKIRVLESPRRERPKSRAETESVPDDLRPDPDVDADGSQRPDEVPPEPSDLEIFGSDPEATFSIYMETIDPAVAELFRSQGEPFRRGYVALANGAPRRALELFSEVPWDSIPPGPVSLERARALLLAGRAEESLAVLDQFEDPDPSARWLRVEVFRDLRRIEEAIDCAIDLVNSLPESTSATDSLLAWTLIEGGRPEEAFEHLEAWIRGGAPNEEVVIPAAQAAAKLDRPGEAIELLESLIQYRLEVSVQMGREPDFPVEAGRRLLALYQDEDRSPDEIRALAHHLLDYDAVNGEIYRRLIL